MYWTQPLRNCWTKTSRQYIRHVFSIHKHFGFWSKEPIKSCHCTKRVVNDFSCMTQNSSINSNFEQHRTMQSRHFLPKLYIKKSDTSEALTRLHNKRARIVRTARRPAITFQCISELLLLSLYIERLWLRVEIPWSWQTQCCIEGVGFLGWPAAQTQQLLKHAHKSSMINQIIRSSSENTTVIHIAPHQGHYVGSVWYCRTAAQWISQWKRTISMRKWLLVWCGDNGQNSRVVKVLDPLRRQQSSGTVLWTRPFRLLATFQ